MNEPIRTKLNRIVRDVILRRFYVFKLYFGRAHSYVDLPLDQFRNLVIFFTAFKVYFPSMDLFWFIPTFVTILIVFTFVGRWDVKNKNADLEHTVMNTVNPQLWDVWNYVKDEKKKNKKVRKQ